MGEDGRDERKGHLLIDENPLSSREFERKNRGGKGPVEGNRVSEDGWRARGDGLAGI